MSISENSDKMSPGSSNKDARRNDNVPTINVTGGNATQTVATSKSSKPTTSTNTNNNGKSKKSTVVRCIIENPDPVPDKSYAGILKGHQKPNPLTGNNNLVLYLNTYMYMFYSSTLALNFSSNNCIKLLNYFQFHAILQLNSLQWQ